MFILLFFLAFVPQRSFGFDPVSQEGEKICIVGDTGEGNAAQRRVARAMEHERCSTILITGDIIYFNGLRSPQDPEFFTKFYYPYQQLIAAGVQFYIVTGNHDWYFTGRGASWKELARIYKFIHYENYYYNASLGGGVCLIGLETSRYFENQIHWLAKNRLRQSECRFSIAMGHVPYKSSGSHGDAKKGPRRLLREGILGVVDLYVSGHDHQLSDEGEIQGTRLLISGAGSKLRALKRKPGIWGVSRLGYIVLQVNDGVGAFKFKDDLGITLYQDTIQGQGIR